jgi:hypothetical protein
VQFWSPQFADQSIWQVQEPSQILEFIKLPVQVRLHPLLPSQVSAAHSDAIHAQLQVPKGTHLSAIGLPLANLPNTESH